MSSVDRSPEDAIEYYRTLRESAYKDQMLATNSTKVDIVAYNTSVALEREVEKAEGEVLKCRRFSIEYYRAVRYLSEASQRLHKFETQPVKKSRPSNKSGTSRD